MKHFTRIVRLTFASLLALTVMSAPVLLPQAAAAQVNEQALCEGSGGTFSGGSCTTPDKRTVTGTIRQVGNILIFITGAISVVMVIVGGMRYALSQGDQNAINGAKNTILYAIIGLVIAAAAYAIVNFVLGSLGEN